MLFLVITRHRFTAIIPHLRTHLEHVVLELLLVFQLRKKPRLLGLCRITGYLNVRFIELSLIAF